MSFTNLLKKPIESIGKNMKPAYPMVAIAIANGIFKPIATLTDKKESPETKKYTALREILTEVVAVPTYLASNFIAEKGAEKLFKNSPDKLKMAKGNIGFIGVCTAAVFAIPALCSVVVKPFTDMIFKKNIKNNMKLDTTSQVPAVEINISKHNNNTLKRYDNRSVYASNGGLKI